MRNVKLKSFLITAAVFAVFAGPALADESWTSPIGNIYYAADLETGEAVFGYSVNQGRDFGRMFINGLAGVFEDRGVYDGVWIEPDLPRDEGCAISVMNPQTGEMSNNWGRLKLVFTEPEFPSGWVAMRGTCFEALADPLIAKPAGQQETESPDG
jgi:hypothetical protein